MTTHRRDVPLGEHPVRIESRFVSPTGVTYRVVDNELQVQRFEGGFWARSNFQRGATPKAADLRAAADAVEFYNGE